MGAAIDFCEEATDDVDDAKHSGRLHLVLVFEVGLVLADVDHLVGSIGLVLLLLHFEVLAS